MKQVLGAIILLGDRLWKPAAIFMRWWLNELIISVPTSVRRYFFSPHQGFFIRVQNDTLQIRSVSTPTQEWDTVSVPEQELRLKAAPVLLLPAEAVLRRTVEFPLAAASSLHETASFQIRRITPFESEQTCHATRLLDRNRARKTVRAEIAVIPRTVLECMLATINARHVRLSAIYVDGDVGKPAFDFLPHHAASSLRRHGKAIWRPVLAVAIIVLLACPFVAAYRVHAAAKALETETAAAGKIVQRASAARSQLEALVAAETFLPERRRGPHAIEALDALARLTPDSTWLFRLELRTSDVLLSGFTSDLPALLQQLEAAPFSTPELTSPVVTGFAKDQNRFDLRVQFRTAQP